MKERTIVRSRGGTAERVVQLGEIIVPSVPVLSANLLSEQLIRSAYHLRDDVARLIDDLCASRQPSGDLFIPNYWKAAIRLSEDQRVPLLELWHLAHDLGRETMRTDLSQFRIIREGVEGMQYYSNVKNA